MSTIQSTLRRAPRKPLSPDLAAAIQPAKEAAKRLRRRVGRFESYDLLEMIYRIYVDWKRRKIAKQSARTLADELNIVRRKGMSPIRILVEAVQAEADLKQKSRWVRALEYIYAEDIPAKRFQKFMGSNGGLAGCARLAVQVNRNRRRPYHECTEGDWTD